MFVVPTHIVAPLNVVAGSKDAKRRTLLSIVFFRVDRFVVATVALWLLVIGQLSPLPLYRNLFPKGKREILFSFSAPRDVCLCVSGNCQSIRTLVSLQAK